MTTSPTPCQDAGLLSPVRAGTPVETAVSDRAWLQAMLDAEAALVRAQARLGTVPRSIAGTITGLADADRLDLRALAVAARRTANPVVGLVAEFSRVVADTDPVAAEYVHRGSTSQDVFDTAAMLVAVRALRIVRADLGRTAAALAGLVEAHRDTLMVGRTLAMHAVPTTFGLKAAGWRDVILDAADRVDRLLETGLPVALGGAAGTLAGYLEYAALDGADPPGAAPDGYVEELVSAFAAETGLAPSALPWHALRTPLADLGGVLAHVSGALGKMAVDIQSLTRTEVAEVTEPTAAGHGASSAMPHKRNPVLTTLIRSAALQVPAYASVLAQSMLSEDERSAGAWHAEWLPLRECLRLAGGAAHTAVELAEGLSVEADRMRENVDLTGSQSVTERIAAVLAPALGKAKAKQLLTEAVLHAERHDRPLVEVLGSHPDLAGHLDPARLRELLDPARYTGAAGSLVDRALRR